MSPALRKTMKKNLNSSEDSMKSKSAEALTSSSPSSKKISQTESNSSTRLSSSASFTCTTVTKDVKTPFFAHSLPILTT
jgi:hypothetical protein